ncbi:hypothetical protein DPMN_105606 [Dreissena polymorpha]|uniref:Uncharacterized protein n=1 Tax=Dreissena polymorpha TaxID=45954 RepID=A0A9D4QIV5_DREPO|nr:hypothetical protein DPMN_105606 [Dreissena polymorpha]
MEFSSDSAAKTHGSTKWDTDGNVLATRGVWNPIFFYSVLTHICELETIDRIQERYFVKKLQFGCKDDFLPVLEHVCEMQREQLPTPESIERATSLFLALIEILDGY